MKQKTGNLLPQQSYDTFKFGKNLPELEILNEVSYLIPLKKSSGVQPIALSTCRRELIL
jgi:hypothetical protein